VESLKPVVLVWESFADRVQLADPRLTELAGWLRVVCLSSSLGRVHAALSQADGEPSVARWRFVRGGGWEKKRGLR
jgi:hypothetical protein